MRRSFDWQEAFKQGRLVRGVHAKRTVNCSPPHTLVTNKHFVTFFNELQDSADHPAMPAAQYVGTKDFFKDYDARLDGPFDAEKAAMTRGEHLRRLFAEPR